MESPEKMYKDKLPWRQVLSLSSANFTQAVMLTMPFTIGVFMVRDFEAAKDDGMDAVDEQVVGRLTGLLAGIFSFSGFLTAYAWGCASNYIGRKPVIIIGNVVSYISMLWFGLSGSYSTALAARAFGGFFNGILGAWKCMIGDSTDVLLQGTFFGHMSLAWGLGCIAGPALGGAFSRPCDRLPHLAGCGAGQLLRARPYFLACLVGSFTLLASLLLSLTLLQETLPQSLQEKGVGAALRRWRQHKRDAAALLPEQDGLCAPGAVGAAAEPTAGLRDDVGTMIVTELAAAKSNKFSSCRAVRNDNDEADAAAVMMEEEDGRHRQGREDWKQEWVRLLGGAGLGRGRGGCLQVLDCRGNLEGSTLPPAGQDGDVAEGRSDNYSGGGNDGKVSELTSALLLHSAGGGGVKAGAGGGGVYSRSDDSVWAAIPAPVHPTSHPHNPSNPKPDRGDPTWTPRSPITNGAKSPPLLDSQPTPAVSLQRVVATSNGLHICSLGSSRIRSSAALLGSTTCATRQPQDSSGGCVVVSSSGSSNSGQRSGGLSKSSGGNGDMNGADNRCNSGGRDDSSVEDTSGGINLHSSSCCTGSDCRHGYEHDNRDANNSFHCTRHEQGLEGTSSRAGLSTNGTREDRAVWKQLPDDSEHIPLMVQQLHQQQLSCPSISPSTASSPRLPTGTILQEQQGTLKPDDLAAGGAAAGIDNNYNMRGDVGGHIGKDIDHRSMEVDMGESGTSNAAAAGLSPLVPGVQVPWYRQLQVVLTILGHGATALIFCALDEVFPIYASAPKSSGGLGMREEQLATPLMFFGVVLMPYSVYGYPPLQRHVGTLRLTRIGLLAAVLTCGLVPAVAEIESGSHLAGMIMLYGAMVVKAFAQCSAFTGSIIAVNAAPPQDQLGAVNGVGQTLAALVRGVGPAVGGVLWAVSLGLHTQGQQFLTFGMISAVAVANWVLYGYVVLPDMM